MRKIRDVLRLKHANGVSDRQIAKAVGLARSTVADCLGRARVAGISWPIPDGLDDAELERRLFPAHTNATLSRPPPDWSHIHKELQRRSMTLQLVWEEYRGREPNGLGYSRFCELYSAWKGTVSATMRQTHGPAEKLFVDYAGDTVEVIDPATGEVGQAHIFVAVLGASNYTYAEGRWSEALPDWIGAHVNAFAAIGGVAHAIVCDNLKAGVTAVCRYEPGINRTYQDLATHYDTAILPARPYKPRDKAKVEGGVLIVQRYVLARLRKRQFFGLVELNTAIRAVVADLNAKVMRKIGSSRNELLATIDRPALKALPDQPYVYAEWKVAKLGLDYHVEIDQHYYSAPHRLIRERIEARVTDSTVEIFHKGARVASHVRSAVKRRHTTIAEHMPSSHRHYAEWTPERIMREAAVIGPAMIALVEAIMKAKAHPEQGFRAAKGILQLAKSYGVTRMEAAAMRGNDIGAVSYGSIKSILQNGLDKAYVRPAAPDTPPIQHANIRGRGYYH
jgi:transposase